MRRPILLLLPLVLLLALPAGAAAGGFATVGLSSLPHGIAAGTPWRVDITVLAHGRTPVDGFAPRVRISSGTARRDFAARPTGQPGVYRADVVFPAAGRWNYTVHDGYVGTEFTYPAVEIAPAEGTAAAAADGGPATGWLWGAAAALVLAGAALAAGHLTGGTRKPEPA